MFLTLLAAEGSSGSGGGLVALLPFLLIAVAMYFLLIRPQRRRMQEQRALSNAVEEGDEVITTAGVYGFVTAIDGDVIWLEIAEGVDVRIARQAISRRIPAADAAVATTASDDGAASVEAPADDHSTDQDSGKATGEQDAPTAD